MIKRYIIIMAACLAAMMACAQKRLATPLSYVPADSVVTWMGGQGDLRSLALALSPSLREHTLGAPAGRKEFARLLRRWNDGIVPQLSLLGGLGDEDAPQVAPSAAVLDEAAELLRLTADARYADALERGLFNLMAGTVAAPGGVTFDKHVAAQALVDGMGRMLAVGDGGVYVNFYVNSTAHVRQNGVDCVVDVLTAMPSEGRVRVRLSGFPGHPLRLRLHLRLPAWAVGQVAPSPRYVAAGEVPADAPVVYVNGRELLSSEMAAGYVVIDREWNSGDEVMVNFPMQVNRLRRAGSHGAVRGAVALQRGPLVYVLTTGHAGCYLPGGAAFGQTGDYGPHGEVMLGVNLCRDAGVPADAAAPAVPFVAAPYAMGPRPVWVREPR